MQVPVLGKRHDTHNNKRISMIAYALANLAWDGNNYDNMNVRKVDKKNFLQL
ncbi:hypothetical protein [Peribacillus glennii]|uniref:hypothetical protein n=1 Tax=Peribacillus glennii TaxID=2303991 RepID=UPI001F25EFFF|nr:hypothetical protein [Peribacillus glennii]